MPERPTTPPFKLVYWPGLPGRGEFIRLAFEEAGVPYIDTAQPSSADEGPDSGVPAVLAQTGADNQGDAANAPPFAPPVLVHGVLTISQTANILLYLGQRFDLAGPGPDSLYRVNALALTALDGLCDEVHDCHHPVGTSLFYEDQKAESLRRSRVFVRDRLPKYLGYFEKVLSGPAAAGAADAGGEAEPESTPWLHAGRITYADLVLFQCLDGTSYQFPRAIAEARASGKYARVFRLYDAVKTRPRIAAYLATPRRQAYSEGIYRSYKELDVLAGEEGEQ